MRALQIRKGNDVVSRSGIASKTISVEAAPAIKTLHLVECVKNTKNKAYREQ